MTAPGGDTWKESDMRQMTLSQFEQFLERDDWEREQEHEQIDTICYDDQEWNPETRDYEIVGRTKVYGWCSVTSTLDGITITYTAGYDHLVNNEDSLDISDDQDAPWQICGAKVVDEDGDEVELADIVRRIPSSFSAFDTDALQITETTDIDMETEMADDMEIIELQIDNAPNLRFNGKLVAYASSSPDQATGSWYSGQVGRWTELRLYKTAGGKYICHQIGRTQWQGERDRYSGAVCETEAEVIAFFGHRWLAKELYEHAGITDAVAVE